MLLPVSPLRAQLWRLHCPDPMADYLTSSGG